MENTFDTLRNLMNEIDKLCETVDKENKQMEKKIGENKEKAYMDMCTELAPYYELYKEMYKKEKYGMSIYLDMDKTIDIIGKEIKICIAFHAGEVYICQRRKDNGMSMNMITRDNDFKSFDFRNYYYDNLIYPVAKNWYGKDGFGQEFELKFVKTINHMLTNKVEKLNERNKELEDQMREMSR